MQGYPLIPRELSSVTGDRSPLIPIIPILGKQMLKLPCLLRLCCSLDVYSSNVLALFVVLSPILDVEGSISGSICLQQRSGLFSFNLLGFWYLWASEKCTEHMEIFGAFGSVSAAKFLFVLCIVVIFHDIDVGFLSHFAMNGLIRICWLKAQQPFSWVCMNFRLQWLQATFCSLH